MNIMLNGVYIFFGNKDIEINQFLKFETAFIINLIFL